MVPWLSRLSRLSRLRIHLSSIQRCFSTHPGKRRGQSSSSSSSVTADRQVTRSPDGHEFNAPLARKQAAVSSSSCDVSDDDVSSSRLGNHRRWSEDDVGADYEVPIDAIREMEYPHMNNGIYLDHSGTTIYARSTVDGFASQMRSNLLGNPHSANQPARTCGDMVDSVREKALEFLGADPRHFDLVFVANATAAIKLVAESFRDLAEKTRGGTFWYGYHKDAHTSLVGVRELTGGQHHCFDSDEQVERWLAGSHNLAGAEINRAQPLSLGLFAYPGQSNMTGRRLPICWAGEVRASPSLRNTYTLFDAAALAVTSPLGGVFADPAAAPDFTCLSFYKIFGFPDLGALVVRRDSGHILTLRKYFGGGTVTMVSTVGGAWHKSKGLQMATAIGGEGEEEHGAAGYSIHDGLEDGTLPFHSTLALGVAIDVHASLYGSMQNISRYTGRLLERLYGGMKSLRHPDGRPVCRIYGDDDAFGDSSRQGAAIAFNVLRQDGSYVAYSDVEVLANKRRIYIRSGGICNPGGLFTALDYEPWELLRAMSAGHHCGPDGLSLIHKLPTGVVRVSLGAMSTAREVDTFISFLDEVFVAKQQQQQQQ